MKIIFVILSIALIFVGIAAVLYVDARSQEEKSKKEVNDANSQKRYTENFMPKQSMMEIDSITSAYNYSFTSENALETVKKDSTNKLNNTRKM